MTAVPRKRYTGGAKRTTGAADLVVGATTLQCVAGGLASWPYSGAPGEPFTVIIDQGKDNEEHVTATAVSGDTLTGLVRGRDGTADQTHNLPFTVHHGLFAEDMDHANEFLSLPTAAGQIAQSTGADTWGVTTAPTITDFTNAPHDHGDADDGGALASPTITGTISGSPTITAPVINDGTTNLDGGTLVLPQTAAPAQTAEGSVVWDTDDNLLTVGDGAGRKTMVDTSSTQTLAGKTLTAPAIADFSAAAHDHGDADDGGALAASITLTTPTIADFTNATHDHGDVDDGGLVLGARGTMAYDELTAAPSPISGGTGDVGVDVTFTAVAARRYKVTGYIPGVESSTAGESGTLLITDGSDVVKQRAEVSLSTVNVDEAVIAVWITTALSGSTTLKLRYTAGGSGTHSIDGAADSPIFLLVEDIGV